MSGPAFFETRMGQRFFDVTMPKIADQLEQLNATLLGIGNALSAPQRQAAAPDVPARPPVDPAPVTAFGTEVMATLAQIAREHLRIVTLEERKLDRLDFYDLGVTSVAAALRATYEAGFAAGVSASAH